MAAMTGSSSHANDLSLGNHPGDGRDGLPVPMCFRLQEPLGTEHRSVALSYSVSHLPVPLLSCQCPSLSSET